MNHKEGTGLPPRSAVPDMDMNSDKDRDIGQIHGDVCPVTGLPVLRKPEWTDVSFGKDYRVTVSIVGDNILRVQPSGYVTLKNQINVLKLTDRVPAEAISGGEQYIHIEDWSNFQGASLGARKIYMDEMQARKRISGVIFCNVSTMFKMSVKMGKTLRMVKFPVHIVDDYSEAVRLALEIQSKGNAQEDKPVISSSKNDVPINVFPSDEKSVCPITSLPITTRPEWTHIPIDDNYSVSFSIIGNAILRVAPNGIITDAGTRRLIEEREKVLKDVDLKGKRYAEIRDHSLIARKPSKKSRMILTNLLLKETNEGSLVGFWVFNAPLTIRLMFDVGVRLHKPSAPVGAVKDYREAAENAVNVLEQNGIAVGIRQYKRFTKDEWHFELENYGIRFELIGDDILYTVAHGSMKEAYIDKFFDLNEKVLEEAGLTAKGYYYRIINWENLEKTTWKARKMYIDGTKDLNRKVPCKLSVVFGLNKFMKTIIGFSKQFVPIPVTTAHDLEEAIAIIEREKRRGPETRIPKMKRRTEETPQDEKIRNYCDEFLEFMGIINWDQEGAAWEGMSDSHPFKSVYDALAIIKEDVDDLFQARKRAEETLQQRNRELLFINRTTRTFNSVLELDKVLEAVLSEVAKLMNVVGCSIWLTEKNTSELRCLQATGPYATVVRGWRLSSGEGFVGWVAQQGESLIVRDMRTDTRHSRELDQQTGMELRSCLCVPMKAKGELIGVIQVVDTEIERFETAHLMLLESLAASAGTAIENARLYEESRKEIAERRRAEESLRESEEKYRTILENIEDGYFEVDLTGSLTFFNDALCRITGIPETELMGLNNREYMDQETAGRLYKAYVGIFQTGVPINGLEYTIEKDGIEKEVETSVSLMKDGNGRPIGFRGIIRDVTERKRVEETIRQYSEKLEEMVEERTDALRKSEEKYRTILENIEDGYYEVDLAGNMTFFNDSVCRITGYSEDELMGLNNREYTDEKNAQRLYEEYNKVYEMGISAKGLEWEVIRKDGKMRFMETSISLMRSPKGRPVGFRGILRDVSKRKKMEEELIEKKRQAEEATRAKSEFLANMSHEIRTPLNGIIGMAELAMDTGLDDDQKNIFHTINTEADALLEVINRVLDFSKIEAGKLEIEVISFDLRYLVEEVAGSLAHRAEQTGLEIASFIAPDLPSPLIGDPGRVRQVLANLTGNALKFTKAGEIYIKVEMVEELEDRVKVHFTVKDSGIGIPKDKQTTIFESFSQADGSTTREYGGTGLGTTISKQLAELMGGEIGVESEEGKGSTFWFTAVFGKETGREVVLSKEDIDLSDLKVLVADGNQTNRFIVSEYLRSWGCMPVAADGLEALGMLREAVLSTAPFDLILTDIQMPKMDGFELIPAVRKIEILNDVPIIVLTSLGRRGDGKLCKDLGVAAYFTQPVRRDDLHQTILRVFGGPPDSATDATRTPITKHTLAEAQRKNGKILLVEDYPTNQQVAMLHLRGAGYHVDLAENGKQGLEAFRRCAYDIILMDMQMPVLNGYEATARIREHELEGASGGAADMRAARVPIVAMTANATSSDREKCMAAGTDDYIAKPLTRKALLAIVEKWLRSSPADDVGDIRGADQTRTGEEILAVSGVGGEPVEPGNELRFDDAPMDYEEALAENDGDEAFLMMVLDGFLERAGAQMETLRQALKNGDAERVREEAHAVKGGSGILMANALSEVALELETLGRSGALEGGLEVFERMERELRLLEEYSLKKGRTTS